MSITVQHRRGNTAQTASFTGALAEITVDTDKKTIVVHDGVTPGGYALAKEADQQDAQSYNHANAAFDKANNEAGVNSTQNTNITNAQNSAAAAFIRANNSLNANTGGAISGNLIPTSDNTYYLGSETNRWHTLYVGNGSINLGGLILSNLNGTLGVSTGTGQPITAVSGTDEYARNHANSGFIAANTADSKAVSAGSYANSAFAKANNEAGVNATQNTNITNAQNTADAAFATANNEAGVNATQNNSIAAAFAKANNEAGVNATQNTNITIAQNTADAAFAKANNEAGVNATQNNNITFAWNHANSAFNAANNVAPQIEPAFTTANGAFAKANNEAGVNATQNNSIAAAFAAANTSDDKGTSAGIYANGAFTRANNSLNANTGGTITGSLTISGGNLAVTGNLIVSGNTVIQNVTTLNIADPLIYLAANNYFSDTVDIGFAANYYDGSISRHTGLFRDVANKEYYVFDNYDKEPIDNIIDTADASFRVATLNANLKSQAITIKGEDLYTFMTQACTSISTVSNNLELVDIKATSAGIYANGAFTKANNEAGVNNTQNNSITSAFTAANTADDKATSAGIYANGAFAAANAAGSSAFVQYAAAHANAAFAAANNEAGVNATQNTNITIAQNTADAAFAKANNEAGVNATQNNNITNAQNTADAASLAANTPSHVANSASSYANGAFAAANTADTKAISAGVYANGAFLAANTADTKGTSAGVYANGAFLAANTADTKGTSAGIYANGAFAAANTADVKATSAGVYANGAFLVANSAAAYSNTVNNTQNTSIEAAFAAANNEAGVNATQNTNITIAQNTADAAFIRANTPSHVANSSAIYANGAFVAANTADVKATSAGIYANGAFAAANTADNKGLSAGIYANGAFAAANTADVKATSAGVYANGAFVAANTADDRGLSAGIYANGAFAAANTSLATNNTQNNSITAAFTRANNSLNANTGGSVTGDITSTGKVEGLTLKSSQSIGPEGGQIDLATAATNSSLLGGNVSIDIYENKLRIFESGGTNRGVYIDIANGAAGGVGTNLTSSGGSVSSVAGAIGAVSNNQLLSGISTVDGSGSGLDADLWDGNQFASYLNQAVLTTSQVQFDTVWAANNGNGENFRVGDDAWIGDTNLVNTIRIKGQQDAANGFIIFGNNDGKLLGRSGSGPLTYDTNTIWHAGNDGTGSGLDADLLDGLNSSDFARSSAESYANSAFLAANTPSHVANSASSYANGAFIAANTADTKATSAGIYANGAFVTANTADDKATSAGVYANGAFARANNSLNANTGGTVTGNVIIAANLTTQNVFVRSYIDLNTAPSNPTVSEGRLFYDNYEKSIAFYGDSNETIQIGQNFIRVWNNSGSTINKGKVVRIGTGVSANGFPGVVLAAADTAQNAETIGFTIDAVSNSAYGYVLVSGEIHDIDTSLFSSGQELFLSNTPGEYQTTPPATPSVPMALGYILTSDVSSGSLLVHMHLMEGKNKANGAILFGRNNAIDQDPTKLYWDYVNNRLGIDTDNPQANLHVAGDGLFTGNLTISGNLVISNAQTITTDQLFVGGNNLILSANVTGAPTLNAAIIVNRGNSPNAYILWDETVNEWIAYEGTGEPGHIILANKTANSWIVYDTFAAYEKEFYPIGANLANSINEHAKAGYATANIAENLAIAGLKHANSAFFHANAGFIAANTADDKATSAGVYANGAFAKANNEAGVNATQNTNITFAWNHANSSYIAANTADAKATSAGVYANGAFVAANNEAGVNATQNTNISFAWNHANAAFNAANTSGGGEDQVARNTANAAFITANTANNTANIAYRTNYISATRQRLVPFQEGGIYFRYRFPDVAGPTANSPTLSVIAGQTYAFDLSALQSAGFGGFQLMTASPFASGSLLSGVTHVSTTGQVTTNVSTSYTSGTLYWTAPTSLVGNTTIGYSDSTYNSIYGFIRVQNAADLTSSFAAANTASNTAVYRSLTPAATKFRIIEGPTSSTWQIDQYSGNFPTIYVISGQTYVFDFNFGQDVGGSASYFKLFDDTNTEVTGNVAYVSSANTSALTGASYASATKSVGSVYWKVPTSAEGKTYKYQNGNNFNTGNIVIISHSALANAANSAGSSSADSYARNHANAAFIAANTADTKATSAGVYANGAFTAANTADNKGLSAGIYANGAFTAANTADTKATSAGVYANGAFTAANTADNKGLSAGIYANGAFTAANTADVKATSAGIYANGAFLVANSAAAYSNTVNNTQNTNISFAYNHANAAFLVANAPSHVANSAAIYANGAFLQANTANNTANNLLKANYYGAGTIRVIKAPFSFDFVFPDISGGNNPTITLIAGQTYAFDLNDPDLGNSNLQFRLRTNLDASGGSAIANVTHVSSTLGVTKNVTSSQVQGTLYWTPSRSLVGNTTLIYDHANYSGSIYGSIRVVDPGQIPFSYNHANAAFLVANTPSHVANSAGIYANGAFVAANTADTKATSAGVYANGAFAAANSAGIYANGAFITANTADNRGLSAGIYANGAFLVANSAAAYSNTVNNTQNTNISFAWNHANAAFTAANSSGGADTYARNHANAAFSFANTVYIETTYAENHANAAFNTANTDVTNINISTNTYGSDSLIPVITVCSNGRINTITTVAVSGGGGGGSSGFEQTFLLMGA